MKTRYAISLIIVAILATVALEETRIAKLRQEIIRLRAIPEPEPIQEPAPAGEEETEETTANLEISGGPEPAAIGRRVPDDFPAPNEATAKALALGPNAAIYFELGLDSHQSAWLEDQLQKRAKTKAEFALSWMQAEPSDRPTIEQALTPEIDAYDRLIAGFLDDEASVAAFFDYQKLAPERLMMEEIRPLLDQSGVVLDLEKEAQVVDNLYQARLESGALDWNSPAALPVIAAGGAPAEFETQWDKQTSLLENSLRDFLTAAETAALLAARAQLKASRLENVIMVDEVLNGTE